MVNYSGFFSVASWKSRTGVLKDLKTGVICRDRFIEQREIIAGAASNHFQPIKPQRRLLDITNIFQMQLDELLHPKSGMDKPFLNWISSKTDLMECAFGWL